MVLLQVSIVIQSNRNFNLIEHLFLGRFIILVIYILRYFMLPYSVIQRYVEHRDKIKHIQNIIKTT